MLKKLVGLLSDAAVYGATSVVGQLISFLLLPLYTSYLTPSDYGIVAMLNIVSVVYQPIANLGISNAIFRRFNTCKDEADKRRVLGTGFLGILASSSTLLVLAALGSGSLGELLLGAGGHRGLVLLTLATGFITSLNTVSGTVLRAERRVKTQGVLSILEILSTILATILFVAVLELGVLGWVLGSMIGEIVYGVGLASRTFRSIDLRFDRAVLRGMLAYGLPMMPHQLQAVGLTYVSQYMLREEVGLHGAGLFNMAQKFALPVSLVVNAIQRAWVPYKFQIHADDRDPRAFFRTATTYYIAGTAYLWLGVSLWGPEVLRLMMNESYHGAAVLIPATALIPLTFGVRSMLATGRELSDSTGPLPLVTFVGLLFVVAGGLVFIPLFGAMGAAFATALGWAVMGAGGFWLAQRTYRIDYQWSLIFGFLALAALLVYAFHALPLPSAPARLGAALVISLVFPAIAALLLYRSPGDRERMTALWALVAARRSRVDRAAGS